MALLTLRVIFVFIDERLGDVGQTRHFVSTRLLKEIGPLELLGAQNARRCDLNSDQIGPCKKCSMLKHAVKGT